MLTQISFLNKQQCERAANKLRYFAELYKSVDLDHAADQFEIHGSRKGEYFSNIIKTSHYSTNQIKTILYRIN